jgi:hypothetical protein
LDKNKKYQYKTKIKKTLDENLEMFINKKYCHERQKEIKRLNSQHESIVLDNYYKMECNKYKSKCNEYEHKLKEEIKKNELLSKKIKKLTIEIDENEKKNQGSLNSTTDDNCFRLLNKDQIYYRRNKLKNCPKCSPYIDVQNYTKKNHPLYILRIKKQFILHKTGCEK